MHEGQKHLELEPCLSHSCNHKNQIDMEHWEVKYVNIAGCEAVCSRTLLVPAGASNVGASNIVVDRLHVKACPLHFSVKVTWIRGHATSYSVVFSGTTITA